MSARLLSDNPNPDVRVAACGQRGRRAPQFFTVGEIAKCLDVSTRTVRRWIKSRALAAHHIGGIVRVSETDFAAFLAVRRNG
jgi:excisionase family DNA binding protein